MTSKTIAPLMRIRFLDRRFGIAWLSAAVAQTELMSHGGALIIGLENDVFVNLTLTTAQPEQGVSQITATCQQPQWRSISEYFSIYRNIGLAMIINAFGIYAYAADPYYAETVMQYGNGVTYELNRKFYNDEANAKQSCLDFAAGLFYSGSRCEERGGDAPHSMAWSLGYICVLDAPGSKTCASPLYYIEHHGNWCSPRQRYSSTKGDCVSLMDLWEDKPPFCLGKKASLFAVGDPIYPLIGSSSYDVDLDAGLGGLKLRYDMRRKLPMDKQELAYPYAALPSFGPLVESSLHKRLIYQSGTGANMQASRGLGRWVSFAVTGGVFVPDPGVRDKLVAISGGWRYVDAQTRAEETYDSTGRLNTEKRADGTVLTYGYSTAAGEDAPAVGYLLTVQDQLGHLVKFKYDASGVITQVTRVDGQVIGAAYTGGNLSQLTWPDGKYLQFIYDKPGLAWALTGVVDEEGKRRVSFGYDDLGRATSTEEGTGFNKYTASWDAGMEPGWNITEEYDSVNNVIWIHHRWKNVGNAYVQGPLGYSNTVGASIVNGMSYASSQTQPGGSGCSAASSSQTFDANANVTSRVDFAGNRSCMAYDASNRETVRVEGLKTADTCPADVASYTASNPGPAKPQRKISTQWHPQWNLQTQVVEPNLITTTVYNDQTDLVDPAHPKLNCAPSAPALPDGSKIAVVCKRYEQATTDTLGDLSAANATVTDSRSWSYSYNQYGQVLTETDPRGKATTYEYWTEPTSFTGDGAAARGHTLGDLKTVTQGPNTANPLKTQYTEYNKLGQVLTTVLPNGSTESREYHLRGWLTKLTQTPAGGGTGLVTQYDYYATGLLKQVTQADGSWTLNTYDDAHRLTDVSSSDGNSEHYELDNAGNRTTESYYKGTDPATRTLVKTVTRTYDALGRMQSVSGLR